jgi:hypothetical protein
VPETNNFRQKKKKNFMSYNKTAKKKKKRLFFVHRFCHLNHMVPKNATWPSPFNSKPSSPKSKKRSGKSSNILATQRGTHLPERDPQIQTNNHCTELNQTEKKEKERNKSKGKSSHLPEFLIPVQK